MSRPKNGICVDGSCTGNPGNVQWKGFHLKTQKQVFCSNSYPVSTNNIAEFLAIVHGLAFTLETKEIIYSDSQTARIWARNGDFAVHPSTTPQVWDLVDRAKNWLSIHPGEYRRVQKWETKHWGENPADFGRK